MDSCGFGLPGHAPEGACGCRCSCLGSGSCRWCGGLLRRFPRHAPQRPVTVFDGLWFVDGGRVDISGGVCDCVVVHRQQRSLLTPVLAACRLGDGHRGALDGPRLHVHVSDDAGQAPLLRSSLVVTLTGAAGCVCGRRRALLITGGAVLVLQLHSGAGGLRPLFCQVLLHLLQDVVEGRQVLLDAADHLLLAIQLRGDLALQRLQAGHVMADVGVQLAVRQLRRVAEVVLGLLATQQVLHLGLLLDQDHHLVLPGVLEVAAAHLQLLGCPPGLGDGVAVLGCLVERVREPLHLADPVAHLLVGRVERLLGRLDGRLELGGLLVQLLDHPRVVGRRLVVRLTHRTLSFSLGLCCGGRHCGRCLAAAARGGGDGAGWLCAQDVGVLDGVLDVCECACMWVLVVDGDGEVVQLLGELLPPVLESLVEAVGAVPVTRQTPRHILRRHRLHLLVDDISDLCHVCVREALALLDGAAQLAHSCLDALGKVCPELVQLPLEHLGPALHALIHLAHG
mmetsp:Transcript_34258/g.84841  ORF Transcript_34258/g.84841 Transcript_34258/m.84841 type:complete len:509 (-) Transcript_34258:984-2510(-)